MHVNYVAPQLSSLHVYIQSDNGEFARRHRVLGPSPSASASLAMTPKMPSKLSSGVDIQTCLRGWPDYKVLHGYDNDPPFISDVAFEGMPYSDVTHDMFSRDGANSALRALRAAEATEVPPGDFRLCNSCLGVEIPLKGSSYRAWRLCECRVCVPRVRDWQVALRVGNRPSSAPANNI